MIRSEHEKLYSELFNEVGSAAFNEVARELCLTDLYFLFVYGLGRDDARHDWLYDRCREVQENPDGRLDLWAREHYKSSAITFALTIQDILKNPEITVGIFSHTRPIAKGFMSQIKLEFEGNDLLKSLFPDVLWANPRTESPRWSLDSGLIVKRKSNPKESTVEAYGLVDGQPTSKHFSLLVYDDVVTLESVSTPDMIAKVTNALEVSYNLGTMGGKRRFIGTRYHFADTYKTIMDRKTAVPRIHPATADGTESGEPVLLSREQLRIKRRDMGPYTFGCFVPDTPVLMADWSDKKIGDVEVGDLVVGYTFGAGERSRMVRSRVLGKQVRPAEVVRFEFYSGRVIIGTRDHKFWHGRAERGYSILGDQYAELQAACSIYSPEDVVAPNCWESGYLAGIFDGEGCISGNTLHISQSYSINPGVCEQIERAMDYCGLPFSVCEPSNRKGMYDYYLTGGRDTKIKFARLLKNSGKRDRVVQSIFDTGTRNIGKGKRDRLKAIVPMGMGLVVNIHTSTGNYVAAGFAVKNCQMLLNPVADKAQGFRLEWLKYWKPENFKSMNLYLLCDPASEKKKSSDYTAMAVVGLGSDQNLYVVDMVRDRLNLTERANMLIDLHRKYKPKAVGYEKYGKDSDIEHIETVQNLQSYRFSITPVGGNIKKEDRIRKLIPDCEQGRFYLPFSLNRKNYEGRTENLVKLFVDDEYIAFPVGLHDDMLDCISRIKAEELMAVYPKSGGTFKRKRKDRSAMVV